MYIHNSSQNIRIRQISILIEKTTFSIAEKVFFISSLGFIWYMKPFSFNNLIISTGEKVESKCFWFSLLDNHLSKDFFLKYLILLFSFARQVIV